MYFSCLSVSLRSGWFVELSDSFDDTAFSGDAPDGESGIFLVIFFADFRAVDPLAFFGDASALDLAFAGWTNFALSFFDWATARTLRGTGFAAGYGYGVG